MDNQIIDLYAMGELLYKDCPGVIEYATNTIDINKTLLEFISETTRKMAEDRINVDDLIKMIPIALIAFFESTSNIPEARNQLLKDQLEVHCNNLKNIYYGVTHHGFIND